LSHTYVLNIKHIRAKINKKKEKIKRERPTAHL